MQILIDQLDNVLEFDSTVKFKGNQWHVDVKNRTLTAFGFRPNSAPVLFDGKFAKRQTHARIKTGGVGQPRAFKVGKDFFNVLGWNALAVVAHGDLEKCIFASGFDLNPSRIAGVFDGVGNKVGENTAQNLGVGTKVGQGFGHNKAQVAGLTLHSNITERQF